MIICFAISTDALVYNSLAEQLNQKQLGERFELQKRWEWLGYIFIPLMIALRCSMVAVFLSIGAYIDNMDRDFRFSSFFKIALRGEWIFALVGVFKLGYFMFLKTDYTFKRISHSSILK